MKGFRKKISLILIVVFLLSNICTQAGAATNTNTVISELNQILVKFKDESKSESIKERVKSKLSVRKLVQKKKLKHSKMELLEVDQKDDILQIINELQRDANVEYVQPNYKLYTNQVFNDPKLNEQWGLSNNGQVVQGQAGTSGVDIRATKAWDISTEVALLLLAY